METQPVSEVEAREFRLRVESFIKRLNNPKETFNPVTAFREQVIREARVQFAEGIDASYSRLCGWERGLSKEAPRPVLRLVERVLGSDAVPAFQACWTRHRSALSAEVRQRFDRFCEVQAIFGPGLEVHPHDTTTIDALLGGGNGKGSR